MWKAELMKGNKQENRPAASVDTLIGRQTELHGDVHFSGGLHVDGKIKGKIVADDDKSTVLSVSETGHIEGDVRVSHVVLNGTIIGDVYAAQRITLSSKARVSGNVYYKLIEMTSGATVNGQLVYQGDQPMPAALTHQDAPQGPPLRYAEEQAGPGSGHA
ncbi:MAG TPA: polymer-forming cytoskeletal protein [Nevskiales bacterium]|nr:polymer-forming cytoskeletal protein [Nevskiales bacterium]